MKAPLYVLYDGDCGMCRRTLDQLRTLDLFHRLTAINARDRQALDKAGLARFSDEALTKDMHVVTGGKVWRGFEAYREIAGRVIVLWPVWPFLWLWPVTWFGRRIYRHVADGRSCEVPGHSPKV